MGNHTPEEWARDLAALSVEFSTSGEGTPQVVQEYVRRTYGDSPEANRRNTALTYALHFGSNHWAELAVEGFPIVGPQHARNRELLAWALYRWLVSMNWPQEIPYPRMDAILETLRGQD